MKQYRGSIKKWLVTIIIAVTLTTSIFGSFFFFYWYTTDQYKKTQELVHTVSSVIGQNVAKIILLNDVSAAADVTTSLESFTTLDSMVLYKLDQTPIYQFSKTEESLKITKLQKTPQENLLIEGKHAKVLTKVYYQETLLGFVLLDIEIKSIIEIIKENLNKILLLFFIIFLFSIFLANYFAKKFTAPILNLVKFLEKIELSESFKEKIYTKGNNEYTHLYDEVNTMLERIEATHEALRIAAVAFETHNGMTITDKNHTIIEVNKSFVEITGYSKEEAIGQTPAILKSGRQDEQFYKNMNESLEKYHYWSGEIYNKHKDGTVFPEYLTIQSVLNENKEVLYYVASFIDLTVQKKTEEKLHYIQKYDSLTGLANKALLSEKIQDNLLTSNRTKWGTLLIINIKDFKLVNEAFGYETGDILLQNFAQRLHEIDNVTLISRMDSDQFCIWFKDLAKARDKSVIESKAIAEYISDFVTQPYKIDAKTINILVEIGIHIYSPSDTNATKIMQNTEAALHTAKNNELKISFFDENYQQIAQNHMDIYSQLLIAIQEEQFELYYQPQYNQDEEVYSAEALIRWNITKDKIIPPNDFIPIAEKSGLIIEIGSFVITQACKQLKEWSKNTTTQGYVIAVNVSTKQFMHKDFIQHITEQIKLYSVNPSLLKVELTESIVVKDIKNVVEKMNQLREIGIQISLDDFGTGYSSLQYLKDLPLDQVKIDQSFVKNMLSNKSDVAIIRSILLMCETLEIDVIAEGVETKEHVDFLKELGCQYFQGYYFSKPKSIGELKF